MEARCRVHRLDTEDLDRAADDPALASLLRDGWTVVAPLVVEDRGRVDIALVLAPPKKRNYLLVCSLIFAGLATICSAFAVGFYL